VESAGTDLSSMGLSMFESLSDLPALLLNPSEEDVVSTGGAIRVDSGRVSVGPGEHVRLTSDGSDLVGVGRVLESRGEAEGGEAEELSVRPVRVFIEPY
jgi:hypothetical protein